MHFLQLAPRAVTALHANMKDSRCCKDDDNEKSITHEYKSKQAK